MHFRCFHPMPTALQVAYEWGLNTKNKGIVITASKSPLPIRTTFEQARKGLERGAIALQEIAGSKTCSFCCSGRYGTAASI
jgi:phosphoketolase